MCDSKSSTMGSNGSMGDHQLENSLLKKRSLISSDSSSDDIVIPMHTRKAKQRFVRKRRSRSTDSSLSMKSASLLSCCPSLCLKLVLILTIISTIALTILFIAKLYDRIDSLQTAINDLSLTGNNVPQEMHSMHAHLKELDANASALRGELSRVLDIISNLTAEVALMKSQMAKIADSVEAAPAIKQIPKELQELQKVVAEMGARMTTNDNEVKSVRDKQAVQQSQSESIQLEIGAVRVNLSELYAICERNASFGGGASDAPLTASPAAAFSTDIFRYYNSSIRALDDKVENLINVYVGLENWRAVADSKINATLNLTHHIHEKLHAKSDAAGDGGDAVAPSPSSTIAAFTVISADDITPNSSRTS